MDLSPNPRPKSNAADPIVVGGGNAAFSAAHAAAERGRRVLLLEKAHLRWLNSLGLKYRLMYERQAYLRQDGTFLFWGGLHVGNVGRGEGLMLDHLEVAQKLRTEVRFGQDVFALLVVDGAVRGVKVRSGDGTVQELRAESVILGAGGFAASPEWRREHLGEGWEHAKVRGTPFNRGEMLEEALEIGAAKGGDWASCHSVQWDAFTPHNWANPITVGPFYAFAVTCGITTTPAAPGSRRASCSAAALALSLRSFA
jgi:hypothetical protein